MRTRSSGLAGCKTTSSTPKVWIHTLKELYELEDVNGDKQLQNDEFEKFWQTLTTILYSPERAVKESSEEKIDRAWAALKNLLHLCESSMAQAETLKFIEVSS